MPNPDANAVPVSSACPCLSGESYDACCGRLHRGEARAVTAAQLMRSRYSAFAVGDVAYLLRSWHPDTRPDLLELDPALRWLRLDIERTTGGGVLENTGTVEFTAFYRQDGVRGSQHELSRFEKVSGAWLYVDAVD